MPTSRNPHRIGRPRCLVGRNTHERMPVSTISGLTNTLQMRTPRIDFPTAKIDALIVASLPNVEYITGFDGSNALILIEESGEVTLFTDPRYTIAAGRVFPGRVVIVKNK